MPLKLSFKVCLIGNQGVGKTSLIVRYIENKFRENYIPTLGVDFLTKKITLGEKNTPVNLTIWDIGGDTKWKDRLQFYLRGSDGAIIVYDITRKNTFKKLDFWIEALYKSTGEIPFIVVGNKKDLEENRNVKLKEAEDYLKGKKSYALLESSAKTGETVNEMFLKIAKSIIIEKAKKNSKK
ncbi:MAG: Rab family GTPase [Candidatus Helarchaeota archaeon]